MNAFQSALRLCAAVFAGTLPSIVICAERPTNLILILTDNQAAWTLGCYGNPDIRTPNIDRLAREGVRFERCFASNAVCSPTRATLLTGLIPSQHGVHSYLTAGGAQIGPRAYNTIAEFRSLPEVLAENGYACGLTGKWHLGDNLRPQDGFTTWVTMPHGHTTTFHNAEVIEDGSVRKEPRYLTEFWTDHAVKFIDDNKTRPFFLFLAFNGPYGLGGSMLASETNRHTAYYSDKELKSFPREKIHPWLRGNKNLLNNADAMRRYAAEISSIDDGVGRIVASLKANNIERDTLVVFTADQGLAAGQNGFWAMGDHTRPLTAYDPMIHVPLIFWHAGHIEPGRHPDMLVSNYDFFPTVLDYLGLKDEVPSKPQLPGRNYIDTLRNRPERNWDDTVYFEYENTRSIRTTDWKLITRFPDGPNELYNLRNDADERHNLIDAPAHVAKQRELEKQLTHFFNTYADPSYDLSRNGKSKASRRLQ